MLRAMSDRTETTVPRPVDRMGTYSLWWGFNSSVSNGAFREQNSSPKRKILSIRSVVSLEIRVGEGPRQSCGIRAAGGYAAGLLAYTWLEEPRSEERRVGKSVIRGSRRMRKKKS